MIKNLFGRYTYTLLEKKKVLLTVTRDSCKLNTWLKCYITDLRLDCKIYTPKLYNTVYVQTVSQNTGHSKNNKLYQTRITHSLNGQCVRRSEILNIFIKIKRVSFWKIRKKKK